MKLRAFKFYMCRGQLFLLHTVDTLILLLQQKLQTSRENLEQWRAEIAFEFRIIQITGKKNARV